MVTAETLLSAYIDANLLLVMGFMAWSLIRYGLLRTAIATAPEGQLRMLNWAALSIALSPIVVWAVNGLTAVGWIGSAPTVSDLIVTQYLHGGLNLRPSQVQSVLNLRAGFTGQILDGGAFGMVLISAVATGALISITRIMRAILYLRGVIAQGHVWRRFGRTAFILSDQISVPFSARGLRCRYVVIPSALLCQPDDLRIVIAHELQHIRQGDIEWEIALEILRPLFFWNPAFIAWKRQVDVLRELACDQSVVARRRFDVARYCDCLLGICRASLARPERQIALVQVAFVKTNHAGVLRRRILSLPHRPATSRWTLGGCLALGLVILSLSVAIQPSKGWSHDRLMLSSILNLERLETLNTLNQRTW